MSCGSGEILVSCNDPTRLTNCVFVPQSYSKSFEKNPGKFGSNFGSYGYVLDSFG